MTQVDYQPISIGMSESAPVSDYGIQVPNSALHVMLLAP